MKPRGSLVAEGKTKRLFDFEDGMLLMEHKDDITAGDGAKHAMLGGKADAACLTTSNVFQMLNKAGVPTHFIEPRDDVELNSNQMLVMGCDMIKLEVVARRVATGSYLKRNPHIDEGTRFVPLATEFFLKDDSRHDPRVEYDPAVDRWVLWEASKPRNDQPPQYLESGFHLTNLGKRDNLVIENLPRMEEIITDVFEVLEEAWHRLGVLLVDLKIEFGFTEDGVLVVADVIDNDSWRIWPDGDKRLQLDKQVFRELDEASADAISQIKTNYQRVAELTSRWDSSPPCSSPCVVEILYGSPSDRAHVDVIIEKLGPFGLTFSANTFSADKTPEELRQHVQDLDRMGVNVAYITVAGRRNALGGIDFHTPNLVINCPPLNEEAFVVADLLSSLRMPSGIGAVTVMYPEAAAIAVAKHFARLDLWVWCRLRNYQREVKEKVIR